MRRALLSLSMVLVVATAAAQPPCGPLPGPVPVDDEPALFAPGWINQGARTRDIGMSPDGREVYFCVMVGGFRYSTIAWSRRGQDGCWSEPEVLPLAQDPQWRYLEPHVTPTGDRLFFVSDRPGTAGGSGDEDIWVTDRDGDQWGEPRSLPAPINTPGSEFFPSVTRDGALYFTRRDAETRREVIMRSRPDGQGGWREPETLPEQVNAAPSQFNAFVDPDERYLIVCLAGHAENLGQVDYWIVFRDADDTWRGPVNLGERVNGPGREGWSPYVSPDGQWFFFMSAADGVDLDEPFTMARVRQLHDSAGNGLGHVWWTSAAFLEELATGTSE